MLENSAIEVRPGTISQTSVIHFSFRNKVSLFSSLELVWLAFKARIWLKIDLKNGFGFDF